MRCFDIDIYEMLQDRVFRQGTDGVYLVTGASGFIGSYCVRAILERNEVFGYKCKVIAVVHNLKKAEDVFEKYKSNPCFRLHECDVRKMNEFQEERIDYIIHAASMTSKETFHERPADVIDTILLGNYNVCQLAKKYNSKLLLVSTAVIYGNVEQEYILEENVSGFDTMKYECCYAEGKRAAETMISAYVKQHEVDARVVRVFHAYGPGNDLNTKTFFSDFLHDILYNNVVTIKGSGEEIRNLCYITDVVKAIFYVLYLGLKGEAYNIGSKKTNLSIESILMHLIEASGKENITVVKKNKERAKNVMLSQCPSVDKLTSLGWTESVTFEDGLKKTYSSIL